MFLRPSTRGSHDGTPGKRLCLLLLAVCTLMAQVEEFSFYPEFRAWWFALPAEQRSPLESVLALYRRRLAGEGVSPGEIDRRMDLIRTRRPDLERDFWNRYLTAESPEFNTRPNAFLASVVQGRPPGKALDVGMGEGRNALYLARLGWEVTGFDPADKAVALASERARQAGLKLRTHVALDREFDFGREQWDLIVLSWVPPDEPAKLIDALRPAGIVVFEGPRFWFAPNGLLQAFDRLRILRYEDEPARGDYFQDKQMPVIRLLAEKAVD